MAFNFTEFFKNRICCCIKNPKVGITYAWLISLLLVFIAFIVACVAANRLQTQSGGQKSSHSASSSSFCAIWTSLMLLVISTIGTVIMRSYQTALSIGFLLGVIFVMTQQMLIIFAIFTEQSRAPGQAKTDVQAEQAMAVFAFFIFLVYAFFGSALAIFRNDIIKQEVLSADPDNLGDDPASGYGEQEQENQI